MRGGKFKPDPPYFTVATGPERAELLSLRTRIKRKQIEIRALRAEYARTCNRLRARLRASQT